jgi:hypothetical protein
MNPTGTNWLCIHAPLFYALLYGRSYDTIQLLLRAYREATTTTTNNKTLDSSSISSASSPSSSSSYSSVILSQYHEVALHIAITTMASRSVVHLLIQDDTSATIVLDMYGLSSLDWLWLCYIREYQYLYRHHHHHPIHPQQQQQQRRQWHNPIRLRQLVSRRRQLPDRLVEWHEHISGQIPQITISSSSCHVAQDSTTTDPFFHSTNINNSNGRHWSTVSAVQQELVTTNHPALFDNTNMDNPELLSTEILSLNTDFFQRIRMILLAAAPVYARQHRQQCPSTNNNSSLWDESDECMLHTHRHHCNHNAERISWESSYLDEGESWNILHAACFVPCPVAIIRWVLFYQYGHDPPPAENHRPTTDDIPRNDPLRYRDHRTLRYPLHYAASRVSYRKTLPPISFLAASSTTRSSHNKLMESTTPIHVVLPLYPEACGMTDSAGQLPFHIAIDTYKHYRISGPSLTNLNRPTEDSPPLEDRLFYEEEEDNVLQLLLRYYPLALHQKDGRSRLFPWQQAAIGKGARLTTIYQLFRSNPATLFFV